MKYLMLGLAVLMLGGCAVQAVDRAEKLHAVVAHEADIAAAFIQKAACHAPLDAMVRWCTSSTDTCRAIWYGCPDARAFVSAVSQAVASEKTFRLVIEPVE